MSNVNDAELWFFIINNSVQDACGIVLEASQCPSFNPGRPDVNKTMTRLKKSDESN